MHCDSAGCPVKPRPGILIAMSIPRPLLAALRQGSEGFVRRTNPRKRFLPTAAGQRAIHNVSRHDAQAAVQRAVPQTEPDPPTSSNPAPPVNSPLSFPCLDAIDTRTQDLQRQSQQKQKKSLSGPEPSYTSGHHLTFHCPDPILLDWGGVLPSFNIAYETWGTLNADKSNAVLLHTGLSASSHAHSTPENQKPGWWERFIGPGAPLDTNTYFVICTNVLGGCYGSTGPSSVDPSSKSQDGSETQERYATRFPILTMQDMVRGQYKLLDHLGIDRLYASVGCSMGGMQSLAAGVLHKDRVGKIVSVSGCARSHPYSIAMRHTQRQGKLCPSAFHRCLQG